MADRFDPRVTGARQPGSIRAPGHVDTAGIDKGLRSYMLSIYNYMASGILLTGIVALGFAQSGLALQVLYGPGIAKYIIMFSPLAIVFAMSFGANRFSTMTLQALFWGFAGLMGLSMSAIFLVFTGGTIALAFFSTAAAFAGLSLWGYTTQKNLSGWGSFLIMGLVGLIVASILNLFLQSGTINLVLSYAAVLIFAGLTAYDTQRLKSMYVHVAGSDMMGKVVILGALSLYLNFINMFQALLSIMGGRD